MEYVGGLRERLVSDSVYNLIVSCLGDMGWFDAGRHHRPIEPRAEAYANDEQIPLNSLVVTQTHTTDTDAELGSNFGEVRTIFYVDFYAENDPLGKHLINDVRDILKGRMPAIGRIAPVLYVRDWTMATPPIIFYCEIEDILVDKAIDFPKAWQKFWWTCRFEVVDAYGWADQEFEQLSDFTH